MLASAPGVAVQSDDPEVDCVKRDHDRDEARGRDQGGPPAAPGAQPVGVQIDRVDDPGDGRPGLLGIPTPPAPPGMLPPDGTRHGAYGPDGKTEQTCTEGEPVKCLQA